MFHTHSLQVISYTELAIDMSPSYVIGFHLGGGGGGGGGGAGEASPTNRPNFPPRYCHNNNNEVSPWPYGHVIREVPPEMK